MRCPVTIAGVTCDAPIEPGEGELVMAHGKGWIVCPPCATEGVRANDVVHAEPVIDVSPA
jgi:hypothetical protein